MDEIIEPITEPITEQITEPIANKNKKLGRPTGTFKTDAIYRNPELKAEHKRISNELYKQSNGYLKSKINVMATKYNLNIILTKTMTHDELKIILMDLKIRNIIYKNGLQNT